MKRAWSSHYQPAPLVRGEWHRLPRLTTKISVYVRRRIRRQRGHHYAFQPVQAIRFAAPKVPFKRPPRIQVAAPASRRRGPQGIPPGCGVPRNTAAIVDRWRRLAELLRLQNWDTTCPGSGVCVAPRPMPLSMITGHWRIAAAWHPSTICACPVNIIDFCMSLMWDEAPTSALAYRLPDQVGNQSFFCQFVWFKLQSLSVGSKRYPIVR